MSREETVIVAVPGHLAVMVATETGEPGLCVHVGVGMTSPLDDAHVTVVNVALEGETTAVNSRVWPLTRLPGHLSGLYLRRRGGES